jgi:hypothetical protein
MEHPTHDTVEPVYFDKAWQRKAHHATELEARDRRVYGDALRRTLHSREQRAQEFEKMKEAVRTSKHEPTWVSYKVVAILLGCRISEVSRLAKRGDFNANKKKKLASLSSVEAYRDTRNA